MARPDSQPGQFSRPGFVAAAGMLTLLVVGGVVIATMNAARGPAGDSPGAADTASATQPPGRSDSASVCGLPGVVSSGSLSKAPATTWRFQDTMAYPTSKEFGPAAKTDDGVRICFQHSPEGALFAAGNAIVQSSDPATSRPWIEHFLSERTPGRAELVEGAPSGAAASTRMGIVGFRLLEYKGSSARVDVAVRASDAGGVVLGSVVYDLVWEAGDWRMLPADPRDPLRMGRIPDTLGYVAWGE